MKHNPPCPLTTLLYMLSKSEHKILPTATITSVENHWPTLTQTCTTHITRREDGIKLKIPKKK